MREVEIIEKRKEKEKHFLREDGTVVARIYNDNVHYKKNGKYEDIDNSLVKRKGFYKNKKNDYQVTFKEESKDSFLRMEKEDSFLEIQLKESKDVKVKKKRKKSQYIENLSYNDILDGVDLEYQTLPTKVKETIVLKNKKAIRKQIIFDVNTNLDLILENNVILAKNKDHMVFTIDAPYMEDAAGKRNDCISYLLNRTESGYEIGLDLDVDWLLGNDIQYPVRIDPTITNYSKENGVYDTYIFPGDHGVDRNGHNILKAGVERINGQDRVNRTLMKFDLPEIGTGSEVINASLIMIGYPVGSGTQALDRPVTIHAITVPWDEQTATWDSMYDKYLERTEAVMIASRSVSAGNELVMPRYNSAYLTTLVKKWYRDTSNYGIMIKSAEEIYVDDGYPAFFSKTAARDDFQVKPFLEITYRNQNGLEGYLDYKSQSFTQGTTYVNSYNGNLTGVWNLGGTIGGKMPVSVGLVYNTNDVVLNKNTIYGMGYKLTLDQTIKEVVIDDYNYLEYVDEDGTIHYFYEKITENGTEYQDEDGLSLIVRKESNQYRMIDKNGNQMLFIKNGDTAYLQKQEDVKQNEITIERNTSNQITRIVDANQAEINFYYEPNKIRVVSPDVITELSYNGGNLVEIKNDQGTSYISYNGNHLITDITDVTGLKINYSYYSEKPYKVQKVTQYGLNNELGNYFTLDYGFETTTITDHKGRTNTLIFNSLGNLLSSNSMREGNDLNQSYSTVTDYGNETFQKNKLLADTVPVRYIKNYIENSSFEVEGDLFDTEFIYYNIQKSHSSDCAVSGYKSCKIVAGNGEQYLDSKRIYLLSNGYYTFSGYFKSDKKVKLSVVRYDKERNPVQNSIEIEPSDQFLRHDITFYHEDDYYGAVRISMDLEDGCTIYIDDVQLEEGEVANDYNIIDNSDFSEGLSGWILESYKTDYTSREEDGSLEIIPVPIQETFEVVKVNNNQNTALKVKMNPVGRSSFEKRFPIKGKKGDIYTVSFWYKNEGVESDGHQIGNDVSIYFKPVGKDADYCIMPSRDFNVNENQWQYFTFRYDADEDYEEIRLIFYQGRNANNLYITNLSFYKDVASSFYDYDESGNVTSIKESSKDESNTFGYDKNNQLISATTPKGKHFKYEYDNTKTDQVLSAIASNGISNQVEYDQFGNPILTRISKKENGELTSGLYSIRSKGTNQYLNIKNRSIRVGNDLCSNTVWKLEKQAEGKIILCYSVLPSLFLGYLGNQVTLLEDTPNTFVIEERENGSFSLRLGSNYLKVNHSILELSPFIENDPAFEFYFELPEEEFIETRATYSGDGRFVTSVTDSNFNKTEYDIDSVTGLMKSMTNAKNQTTDYTYNGKKQITSVTQGEKTVNYTYNDKNLLEKIVQGWKEYQFTYDNFLNPKTVSISDDITLVTQEYEENNGNLVKTIYGNDQEIGFEYDEFDRQSIIHKMDKDYHYKYDSNGNIAKVLEFNPTITYDTSPIETEPPYDSITKYNYDSAKRLEDYQKDDFRIHYTYDKNDNVTSKKYRLNGITHSLENTFNKDDQITKITVDNSQVDYEYDRLSRLKNKTINDNYKTEYEYVSKGRRTSELVKSIKNGSNKYSYQYDPLNNITHVYYNDELQKQYYYDEYNELIKEEDYQKNEKIEYIYDNSGNLLTKITKNLETDVIIDSDTYEYSNNKWEDQLTKFNNQAITYDAIGNPLSIGNT
ncbi:MAG: RHS repeat protein, partial [Bacilli bacterium]|nr:RHS repeat protein [Bacilli bacterium]